MVVVVVVVLGWSDADSGIYYRGAPCTCIGEGSGGPPRSLAGPGQRPMGGWGVGQGLSPPEAPGN